MFKLNYKYQDTDTRDHIYNTSVTANNLYGNSKLFELKINKVYDQSQLGACVSNALATYITYLNSNLNPSRLYIYFNGRLISKLSSLEDSGLSIRDGCKSVAKYCTCSEIVWPYNISEFTTMPDLSCYVNSYKYINFKYQSVNQDINSVKIALLNNNPILFGFDLYESFYSNSVSLTGIVPMPNKLTEQLIGAHCCIIIGFNDDTNKFKCVNSWSSNWGDNGFFYAPYSYLLDTDYASDFWIINFTTEIKTSKINKKILRKISIKKNI